MLQLLYSNQCKVLKSQSYIIGNAIVHNAQRKFTNLVFHVEVKDKYTIEKIDKSKNVRNVKGLATKTTVTAVEEMVIISEIFNSLSILKPILTIGVF